MNGWSLRYPGVDPADEGRPEALRTLGNGVFATRGSAPEHVADGVHYPGTYAAGIYNRLTDQVDGTRVTNESLVNLPGWLFLTWAPEDDEWYPSGGVEVLEHGGTTFPLAPGQSHEVDLTGAGPSPAGPEGRATERQLAQPGRR